MGDSKKPKKLYKKPGHPWEAERIKEEIGLKKEYGLSNKKEIWKTSSKLRDWRSQARQFILHGKIDVNDKIITAPSYLVKRDDKLRLKPGFIPVITRIVRKDEKLIEAIKSPENKEQVPAAPKTDKQVVEEVAKKATKEASA